MIDNDWLSFTASGSVQDYLKYKEKEKADNNVNNKGIGNKGADNRGE